jgi:hypothetical protein
VSGVDVEHENPSPTEFEIVADPRRDDIQKPPWGVRIGGERGKDRKQQAASQNEAAKVHRAPGKERNVPLSVRNLDPNCEIRGSNGRTKFL